MAFFSEQAFFISVGKSQHKATKLHDVIRDRSLCGSDREMLSFSIVSPVGLAELQGCGISMVGRLVCAIAQGYLGPWPQDLEIRVRSKDLQHSKESIEQFSVSLRGIVQFRSLTRQDIFGILNMLLSFTAGVFMFKVAASAKTDKEQDGIRIELYRILALQCWPIITLITAYLCFTYAWTTYAKLRKMNALQACTRHLPDLPGVFTVWSSRVSLESD